MSTFCFIKKKNNKKNVCLYVFLSKSTVMFVLYVIFVIYVIFFYLKVYLYCVLVLYCLFCYNVAVFYPLFCLVCEKSGCVKNAETVVSECVLRESKYLLSSRSSNQSLPYYHGLHTCVH